jgi:hypothetical protein
MACSLVDMNLLEESVFRSTRSTGLHGIVSQKTVFTIVSTSDLMYLPFFLVFIFQVGQNWGIKIANRSFENVPQFKYLGRK